MSELDSAVYVFASKGMQGPSASARWRPRYESTPNASRLSSRESEVLHWLAYGKSGPEIAIILGISTCTVRIHIQSVKRKLDAANIPHAVYLALTRGILRL
jgi:DNA-binding CsgD family transcriptional regulator